MPYVHIRLPYFKLDGCGPLRTTCYPSLKKQLSFVAEFATVCTTADISHRMLILITCEAAQWSGFTP
ncbi:hypothetical protein T01_10 [Trichinella spiralis]|uniref:Uncharacterized protein n=1 Tax=Trichinella spiralis TaxID=6334 RepID=A0A0V1BK23_TRISP|nr:hypothetical protein T01_10 [Trichinella spiralis]